jgi:DNA-binding NarL/FixJ family response regulator
MSTPPIRIIIGDDHPLMVDALCTMFAGHEQFRVVATGYSFSEVAEAALTTPADLVILDLTEMDTPAWGMLERLQRDAPHLKVVIFSSRVDLAPEVLRAGAAGYVTKEERASVLLAAVTAVAAGGSFCSSHVEAYLARGHGEASFTPQEWVTLKLLEQVPDTVRTAQTMGVVPRAVQNYVTSMLRKKGFSNRYELIEWYRRTYVSG